MLEFVVVCCVREKFVLFRKKKETLSRGRHTAFNKIYNTTQHRLRKYRTSKNNKHLRILAHTRCSR